MAGGDAKARMARILRLHEEIDAIKLDIRDIYAEEKADGGDKTAMGAAVSIIRKREKDATKFDDQQGMVDVYLTAYLGSGTIVATHTHASEPQPTKAAGQAAPEVSAVAETSSVESEAAEISAPINGETGMVLGTGKERPLSIAYPDGDPEARFETASLHQKHYTGKSAEASAPAAPIYPAPGVVVMEHTPPEGAVAHPYAACWPVNLVDPAGGIREPIVKIGRLILDGRGRMFAARGANGGNGIEGGYPVVQYDGVDPLMDCIRWNLASRPSMHLHNLKLIASKLVKLEPTRADEIMQAFGLEVAEAAE